MTTKHKIKFLDEEEKELYDSVERGEWVSVSKKEREKDLDIFKRAMKNTFGKTRPISFRINEVDLVELKAQALEQGLPYQTLLSSIIHQYVKKVGNNQ